MHESIKAVVSYDEDVFVWVYLDQVDRVLRYEAYVVDYDDNGHAGTLKFVIEEGVLDNVHEVPLFQELLQHYYGRTPYARVPLHRAYTFTIEGQLVAMPPLLFFYNALTDDELALVHTYFAAQEERLKHDKRARWIRILRALGFDVIPSLASSDGSRDGAP